MIHRPKTIAFLLVLVVPLFFLTQCAQMQDLGIPSIPSLSSLTSRTPVTTNIKDAVTEIPYMDAFEPKRAMALNSQPRNANGGFDLRRPGFYTMNAQSYCMHAGTYAPGGGDGYIYAPLKGSRDDIIGNILKRSVRHPQIPQRDIQVLIWAICAKTKIQDMSAENIATASKLLTPTELAVLNDVMIEEELQELVGDNIPSELRQVLEAESKLRSLMTSGQAAYSDLEKVAVLTGAAPWGPGSRKTPTGRWSYQPDGYFVRYYPQGYSKTRVDVYAPECIEIVRDDLGRIILIRDRSGSKIEVKYKDPGRKVRGDSGIIGYAFSSIRLATGTKSSKALANRGWTYVGVPNGKGSPGAEPSPFTDMSSRYDWAENWVKANKSIMGEQDTLDSVTSLFKSKEGGDTLMDLAHFEYALRQAGASSHTELVRKAWLWEVCVRQGRCQQACLDMPQQTIPFDPSESVATPGNTSRQRLGQSARVYK